MQLPEVPNNVLQAAETISRWAKETNHSAFRIGSVVYATDYQDIRPLFMLHETLPAQEDEPVAWMIDYAIEGMNRRGIFGHNPIADYRELDPNATSTPLYTRP